MGSEQEARKSIDRLLASAGRVVRDFKAADIQGAPDGALRTAALIDDFGLADYLSCIDGEAAGVAEAEKRDATHTGVEPKACRYSQGRQVWRLPPPGASP